MYNVAVGLGRGCSWCLMPLSTIFQLYRGSQFSEYPKKTIDLPQVTDQHLSHWDRCRNGYLVSRVKIKIKNKIGISCFARKNSSESIYSLQIYRLFFPLPVCFYILKWSISEYNFIFCLNLALIGNILQI
jgi:hypothetical protein